MIDAARLDEMVVKAFVIVNLSSCLLVFLSCHLIGRLGLQLVESSSPVIIPAITAACRFLTNLVTTAGLQISTVLPKKKKKIN